MFEKWDRITIDGNLRGTVVQDGINKSLVAHRRSDGEPGTQQEWYANERLTLTSRRATQATGDEPEGVTLY